MIKVVAFDLDDTLYYELDYVKSGFKSVSNYISRKYDIDFNIFYNQLLEILETEGRGKTFDIALNYFNLPLTEVEEMLMIYRNHIPVNLKLYPDAERMLRKLKGKYNLGLITDGCSTVQWIKIKSLGLKNIIDEIIVTDDFGADKRKPSSFAYLKLIERFKVNPEEIIYIGDNPEKDFVTARKLGLKTVRVIHKKGMHINKRLSSEYEADYEITSLDELELILDK